MAIADRARIALAAIRTVNGVAALVAPGVLASRMTNDANARTVSYYPYRLFGIRTVLLGLDLIISSGAPRHHALQEAVVIHAVDTVSAARAGVNREVNLRFALTTTAISAINTLLAVVAFAGSQPRAHMEREGRQK